MPEIWCIVATAGLSLVSIITQPTHATQLNANARNATQHTQSTHASHATQLTQKRTQRKRRTQRKNKKNASYTRCTTSTVFCVLKACVLITSRQRMLVAFLLYKRLLCRCRRCRYRFCVKNLDAATAFHALFLTFVVSVFTEYSHIGLGTRARN